MWVRNTVCLTVRETLFLTAISSLNVDDVTSSSELSQLVSKSDPSNPIEDVVLEFNYLYFVKYFVCRKYVVFNVHNNTTMYFHFHQELKVART